MANPIITTLGDANNTSVQGALDSSVDIERLVINTGGRYSNKYSAAIGYRAGTDTVLVPGSLTSFDPFSINNGVLVALKGGNTPITVTGISFYGTHSTNNQRGDLVLGKYTLSTSGVTLSNGVAVSPSKWITSTSSSAICYSGVPSGRGVVVSGATLSSHSVIHNALWSTYSWDSSSTRILIPLEVTLGNSTEWFYCKLSGASVPNTTAYINIHWKE